jgi:hypothetical protein
MPSMRIREPRIGSSRESREAPEIRTIRAIRCFRLIEIAMVVTAASVEQRRVALRVGPPGYFEQYDPLSPRQRSTIPVGISDRFGSTPTVPQKVDQITHPKEVLAPVSTRYRLTWDSFDSDPCFIQDVAHPHRTGVTPALLNIRIVDVFLDEPTDNFRYPRTGVRRIVNSPGSGPRNEERRSDHLWPYAHIERGGNVRRFGRGLK